MYKKIFNTYEKNLQRRKKNTFLGGFTLLEMLVVTLIIAIFAGIAFPFYTRAVNKSRAVEGINLLKMIREAQTEKFITDSSYYTSFSEMGPLTTNKEQEQISGSLLKFRGYTVSLNNEGKCATVVYTSETQHFVLASNYQYSLLGCTGDVCDSMGDWGGTAEGVCGCAPKTCANGFSFNRDICACDCNLGCSSASSCFAPYGGGSSKPCASGCGSQTSVDSCNGPVWESGSCASPTQTQPTTQNCGNNGTQTRTCSPTCGGGTCGAWSACTGQTCSGAQPQAVQACGNCGTQTRSVTCDGNSGTWVSGSWGACTSQGECAVGATTSCGSGGTKTCSATCSWGSCVEGNKTCSNGGKPKDNQKCGNCDKGTQTRTITCNTSTGEWITGSWSECVGGGECVPDQVMDCGGGKTQTCLNSCKWGSCKK